MGRNMVIKKVSKSINRVILSPVKSSHAALVAKWKNDNVIGKYALSTSKKISASSQYKDIKAALKNQEHYFLIRLRKSLKSIGYVRTSWMDEKRTIAWLRYAIGEAKYRGYGYSREALSILLNSLFKKNVHRIEAEVYEFNLPSIAILKKLGFRQEGRKQKAHYDSESKKYCDILIFGLLAESKELTSILPSSL